MNDLMSKVENVDEDIKPENYKDYKSLKANIKEEKDLNMTLTKELSTIAKETIEQRDKALVYADRIRAMEEVVGMIADNDEY